MRFTQLFGMSLSLSLVLAACGDDGGTKKPIIDAPAGHMDAAPDAPKVCTLPATIAMGAVGSMAMPASGNFIIKDTASGMIFFGLKVYLDAGKKTDIGIIVPRPASGFTPGTINLDGTAGFAFLEGGLDVMGMNPTQSYDNTNGSITFTSIGQTAGSSIKGTVSATSFAEVDGQDNPVAGGCTSMLAGMTLTLTQMTTVSAPTGPNNPGHAEQWKLQVGNLPAQIYTIE